MRIALWGNFGALNLGNECVLAATVSNLRARLPQAELCAVGRDAQDISRRHGIPGVSITRRAESAGRYPKVVRMMRLAWLESREWLRTFRLMGRLDALVITGCGILSDLNEGSLGLPYELLKWSLTARMRGVRLLYISVGAETLTHPISRRQIRRALALAEYRSYRDENSAALLAQCGVATQRDAVTPDLAFGLTVPPVVAREPIPVRVAIGVIDFRGLAGADGADSYRIYLDRMCALVEWLLSQGHTVRVVVGDFRYDDEVRADLRGELERRRLLPDDGRYVDDSAESFEALLPQLQSVDYVIASRYHNVLLALLLGKPTISLSYERKHEALMASMGQSNYCQSIAQIDVPGLVAQFERLQRSAQEVRGQIEQQVRRNQDRLAEQFDEIAARLGARGEPSTNTAR